MDNLGDIVGVTGAILCLIWGVFLPAPDPITPTMQITFGIFGFALLLWLTEAVSYVISSTTSVVLLFGLGAIETLQTAVVGFASSLVFFLLLLFLLGQAISKVNLDTWVASRLLTGATNESAVGPLRAIASHVLLLACFMPSGAARAITFIPIIDRIIEYREQAPESSFGVSTYLIISHINPIASMALMTGGGMPIVTSDLIDTYVGSISWTQWAVLMIPPVLVLYLFAFAVLEMGYRHYQSQEAGHQLTHAPTATRTDDHQHDRGSFSRDQRIVGSVLGGTVCLWVVGSFLGLPTIVPAAVSVFVLSIPPIGILTTEDVRQVNWGILFILGGMLSILEALQSTGALAYLTRAVTDALVLESFLPWQVVGGLLVLAAVIRLFFSTGSAALIVTIPIILQLAQQFQINTLYLTLALLLVIGSTALLPFHTTSTLVSFDEGPLSNRIVFVFGFVTMVGSFAVVALSWGLYWPLIAELLHLP